MSSSHHKRKVLIASPALHKRDAIGNNIFAELDVLNGAPEWSPEIYAEFVDEELRHHVMPQEEWERKISQPDTIVILHYGVYWSRIEEFIAKSGCQWILRYHNITPAKFFAQDDPGSYHATKLGQDQIQRLLKSVSFAAYWPDSNYNAQELVAMGAPEAKMQVIAPFPTDDLPEKLGKRADSRSKSAKNVILFVGRVVPNKGHEHLLKVMHRYSQLYDKNFELRVVGNISANLASYYKRLEAIAAGLGLGDCFTFTGGVKQQELERHFAEAQAFLCLSEHEGFCVPVVEAQRHGLPVLAYGASAVGETVGCGGIVLDTLDYTTFAVALRRLMQDRELWMRLQQLGYENVQRFSKARLSKILISYLELL